MTTLRPRLGLGARIGGGHSPVTPYIVPLNAILIGDNITSRMIARGIGCVLVLSWGLLKADQPSSSYKGKLAVDLIQSLHKQAWSGATNLCNPACWMFNFTAPMQALLDLGSDAQESLIKALTDEEIRDQAIILLGGVGDERAMAPVIEAMKSATSDPILDRRRRTLLAGNLAFDKHYGG